MCTCFIVGEHDSIIRSVSFSSFEGSVARGQFRVSRFWGFEPEFIRI